jgi:N-acetylmuramoyl-L-alanine amidase
MLIAKGATVLMTHTDLHGMVSDDNQIAELNARSELAVQDNVDMMVSIHNNAFPDGTNPFFNFGTSTFYFHPFSAPLAYDLDREISSVTGIPNLGAMKKSLAICRPTWMPFALTESLYLMFPDQESALRDPAFLDKLAAAHVRGIEDFLRERAE